MSIQEPKFRDTKHLVECIDAALHFDKTNASTSPLTDNTRALLTEARTRLHSEVEIEKVLEMVRFLRESSFLAGWNSTNNHMLDLDFHQNRCSTLLSDIRYMLEGTSKAPPTKVVEFDLTDSKPRCTENVILDMAENMADAAERRHGTYGGLTRVQWGAKLKAEVIRALQPPPTDPNQCNNCGSVPSTSACDAGTCAGVKRTKIELEKSIIREVLIRNGFTIKEGQEDLKDYVYKAYEELLNLSAVDQTPSGQVYGIIDPDYGRIFTMARTVAWQEGYSVSAQGSFTRDLDLLAVPWTEHARKDPFILVQRFADAAGLKLADKNPGIKPHGRLAWTLLLPGFGEQRWVDFSMFPVVEKKENE